MRIFLAGGTGAIGTPLVPMLVAGGHEVVATTRSASKAERLRAAGAVPVVLDGLDRDAVVDAVAAARPEMVIHQLTALAGFRDMKRWARGWEQTDRLRTEGTDHLLEGARRAGARRFVAQSYAGWPYAREGGPVKTEEDRLDPDPPAPMRRTLDAIRHVEGRVLGEAGLQGVVLRYGALYGPGTSVALGGDIIDMVLARRFPVVGGGTGVWSFIHIDDAAAATAAAAERGAPGVYNIVDDEPAPVSVWLPELARAVGAKPPLRIPAWLAAPLVGAAGVSLMTRVRGASNAKARRELGWEPGFPSWRGGFRDGLAADRAVSR